MYIRPVTSATGDNSVSTAKHVAKSKDQHIITEVLYAGSAGLPDTLYAFYNILIVLSFPSYRSFFYRYYSHIYNNF